MDSTMPLSSVENKMKGTSYRRLAKPMVEKRRRDRINTKIGELKALVLEAMKKEPDNAAKLEKADILELTVKYLRYLKKQSVSKAPLPTDMTHQQVDYNIGFMHCAHRVSSYLKERGVTSVPVMEHLADCCPLGGSNHPAFPLSPVSTSPPMERILPIPLQECTRNPAGPMLYKPGQLTSHVQPLYVQIPPRVRIPLGSDGCPVHRQRMDCTSKTVKCEDTGAIWRPW